MPTGPRPSEDAIIDYFLRGYESGAWSQSQRLPLDKEQDGAVEMLATHPGGVRLAIEHTLIEPFEKDKEDFAFFASTFLPIEEDKSLVVPRLWIKVFVPVGILHGQRSAADRQRIAGALRKWISDNRLTLPIEEKRDYEVPIPELKAKLQLQVETVPLPDSGVLHVRRQQTTATLGLIVDRALRRKVPKLTKTPADRRVLILERQHMNLFPLAIMEEIDQRRSAYPHLAGVNEIWIVETMHLASDDYIRFERWENGRQCDHFEFYKGAPFPGPANQAD